MKVIDTEKKELVAGVQALAQFLPGMLEVMQKIVGLGKLPEAVSVVRADLRHQDLQQAATLLHQICDLHKDEVATHDSAQQTADAPEAEQPL
jgi:hypothetical protein